MADDPLRLLAAEPERGRRSARRRRHARADRRPSRGRARARGDAATSWRGSPRGMRSSPASAAGRGATSSGWSASQASPSSASTASSSSRRLVPGRARIAEFARGVDWPAEQKPLSVSFHFRRADDEAAARAYLTRVADAAAAEGFVPRWGRMVLEVRPPVDAHKGTAVRTLVDAGGSPARALRGRRPHGRRRVRRARRARARRPCRGAVGGDARRAARRRRPRRRRHRRRARAAPAPLSPTRSAGAGLSRSRSGTASPPRARRTRRASRSSRARRGGSGARARPNPRGARPSSASLSSTSRTWRSTSITTCRPRAVPRAGPPFEASGATWPTMNPCVAPENRPSVIRATESESPSPTMAPVTWSISRIPGPPCGPS